MQSESDMPGQTRLFLCLQDNYGVLLHDPETGATAAIDAPEAAPIEATPEMMGQSLLKLRGLPDETRIYCGHEYTKANVRFAKTIEPANAALTAREKEVEKLLAAHQPTIPSTMGSEKAANPFLRADVPEVAKPVGLAGRPARKVFAEIRERKNRS